MENTSLDNLRELTLLRQKNRRLNAGQVAAEVGCSPSTISRFLKGGGGMDAETRLRIGRWIGLSDGEIFGQRKAETNGGGAPAADPLSEMRRLILADESVSAARREDLCRWFEITYETFALKQ